MDLEAHSNMDEVKMRVIRAPDSAEADTEPIPTWRSWSDDLINEQERLISRGVRPLAWLGDMPLDESEMESCFYRLRYRPSPGPAIPFVLPIRDDGVAVVGFAAEPWVIDVLKWCYEGGVPKRMFHCVLGMLLGYSTKEIGLHDLQQHVGYPSVIPQEPTQQGCGYTSGPDIDQICPLR